MNLSDYDIRKEYIWETAKNPELPQWFFAFSATWLIICWFVGCSMNGIVLLVFAINKELRVPFNYVLMNLNFSDFLSLGFGIPFEVIASIQKGWHLGPHACNWLGFVMTLSGMGSLYTLMALSVIRCVIVCYPAKSSFMGTSISTMSFTIIWFLAAIITLPPLLGWSEFMPEVTGLTCAPNWFDPDLISYAWYLMTMGFFFPLCVIGISSVILVMTIKKHSGRISMSGHMRSIMKRERRVTLMILAMLVAYLGTWTPYAVICILRMCGFHLSPLMDGYALLTAKTSGAINPFIFIFMNKSLRKVVIPARFRRNTIDPAHSNQSLKYMRGKLGGAKSETIVYRENQNDSMSHFMEIKPLDPQLRGRQSLPSVEIPLEIVDFDMNNPIILDPKGLVNRLNLGFATK